jgi:hypothetical protein
MEAINQDDPGEHHKYDHENLAGHAGVAGVAGGGLLGLAVPVDPAVAAATNAPTFDSVPSN